MIFKPFKNTEILTNTESLPTTIPMCDHTVVVKSYVYLSFFTRNTMVSVVDNSMYRKLQCLFRFRVN